MLMYRKGLWFALALVPGFAMAGNDERPSSDEVSSVQEDVKEAAEVMGQMQSDPRLAGQLAQAKAVFVVPDYATGALLVGGSGGEGVLLQQDEGEWSNPAFYDVGSIDIGAQAGATAGSIALLLMTDEAVDNFRKDSDFELTSEAGLTIVNWSASTGASTQDGDIVMWSDMKGLKADASVGIAGIQWDDDENNAYYDQDVTADQVLTGSIDNPHEDSLRSEFAAFSTQSTDTSRQ